MQRFFAACALVALVACAPSPPEAPRAEAPAPSIADLPAGAYKLDPTHSTLHFRVSHIGMSNYTASFARWDATMQLDPHNPEAARIEVRIDPRSLYLPAPPAGFLDTLLGPEWLAVAQFPEMSFRSSAIERTGPATARITGDLTLHGVTKPVTLEATFNGGYAGHPMDPNARLGFSAHGSFKRSDFGVSLGVPPPGSTMGVGDDVEFIVETEFNGPAWTPPPASEQKQ